MGDPGRSLGDDTHALQAAVTKLEDAGLAQRHEIDELLRRVRALEAAAAPRRRQTARPR